MPDESGKNHKWVCTRCGFLLGWVDLEKETFNGKYKDLYFTVKGRNAEITVICRRCGIVNKFILQSWQSINK